jgi:dipeptidase E
MKYYLSSYKIGNEEKKLLQMTEGGNKRVAYINNALDFATDLARKKRSDEEDMAALRKLGFFVDLFDLKEYFNNPAGLEKKFDQYGVIWVRGGNVFVLAQAMRLSGFDEVIKNYHRNKKNIVYGGYSAGICILGSTLKGIHLVDDPGQRP